MCYLVEAGSRRSWTDADRRCSSYGARLATVLTPDERAFLAGALLPAALRAPLLVTRVQYSLLLQDVSEL